MHQSDVTERGLFSLSWPIFIDLLLHFSTFLINTDGQPCVVKISGGNGGRQPCV